MPSLNHLNPPPHPFWDFVASMDEHPFLAAYAPNNNANPEQNPFATESLDTSSGKAQGKQTAAEDPPVIDPASVDPNTANTGEQRGSPFGGPGRHHGPPGPGFEGRRGPGCRGRGGWGGRGGPFGGPRGSPFTWGPQPFWAGPRHHSHPHHHPRGPPREREGATREREETTREGFNLGEFLNNLGDRLGVDLAGAAENLGLDKYSAPRTGEDVDFEPRGDIFDTPGSYIVHLSLPGAKKQDVGVDWDGENSVLRVTGVVHRPDVDEQMLAQLVVDGRKKENGVFEKAIRLGTKRDPASIDVAGISAKMTDGVLVVKIPKVERELHKREVPISDSASPEAATNEKDLLFDADEEMYDAPREKATTAKETTPAAADKDKKTVEHKAEDEETREDRSVTAGREEEHLPAYEGEGASEKLSDWEKDSDEEADYVKINVD